MMSVLLKSGMTAPMTTHTPGPWIVNAECVFGKSHKIASMNDASPDWQEDRDLIAAAPDMLAALKGWIAFSDKLQGKPATMTSAAYMDVLRDIARAAIAKAEGAA
jgi:hypothetical protein